MAHTRCFNNGLPALTPKDVIANKKSMTIYNHLTQLTETGKTQNFNGKTMMDCSGFLTQTSSFAMLKNLQYGQALCAPCDISGGCLCTLDICGNPTVIAWNYLEPPESWNASTVIIEASGHTYFTLCGPSGNTWTFDGSANILDNSGAQTYDGSGVCIISPGGCEEDPAHSSMLENATHAYEVGYTYTGGRPRYSMYNYLQNVSGFKFPSRIRFYR